MKNMPELKNIEYTRSDGTQKTANIIPVEFPTTSLSQEDFAVIDSISRAASGMTPIYADQQGPQTLQMFRALKDLEGRITNPEDVAKLDDYMTLFSLANAPYDALRLTMQFPIGKDSIPSGHPILAYNELLNGNFEIPLAKNLYPADITEKEFESLGNMKNIENSSVIRDKGKLKVVRHEKRYKMQLKSVIAALEQAKLISTNPNLNEYISATVMDLKLGTKKSRRDSALSWIKSTGAIDFIIGTGIENYNDKFKGIRANAQGGVFVIDKVYESISAKLLGLLPELEAKAPWQNKKGVDTTNLPRLSYVNVYNWAGFYDVFPMIVLAESLPNDKEIANKYGSINVVFTNIQKACKKAGGLDFIANEFFIKSEKEKYLPLMTDISILMTAEHELGHTTGGILINENPDKYFGTEYSRMEEARAELFSLYALPTLRREGIITADEEIAGHYSMLSSLIGSLQLEPMDHSGARNMMFHYFLKHGAIIERKEDGKTKYAINQDKVRPVVENMLGRLGDIKAFGDREGLEQFKAEFLSNERQNYFKQRLDKQPLGKGVIFPTFERKGERYTGNLLYPSNFRAQGKTIENFI